MTPRCWLAPNCDVDEMSEEIPQGTVELRNLRTMLGQQQYALPDGQSLFIVGGRNSIISHIVQVPGDTVIVAQQNRILTIVIKENLHVFGDNKRVLQIHDSNHNAHVPLGARHVQTIMLDQLGMNFTWLTMTLGPWALTTLLELSRTWQRRR